MTQFPIENIEEEKDEHTPVAYYEWTDEMTQQCERILEEEGDGQVDSGKVTINN